MAEYLLGLDYGSKRVGVAVAHVIARLPRPLMTLSSDDTLLQHIKDIIVAEDVARVVVGVPRGIDGAITDQSKLCEAFASLLASEINIPVVTVDETLSSVEAEAYLAKNRTTFTKAEIDEVAAAVILERFITEHQDDLIGEGN
ncbi:Holliday junction resolvase RuvX [Candidatus Saccharibacteria bacterium]|nr:Holliday junction resolvase RuvX [Candidatus Saccharibacteria bacterium]